MKRTFLLSALFSVALFGAGCTSANVSTAPAKTAQVPVADASAKIAVPYSQLKGDLMNIKDDYNTITFTVASGDCAEKGLPGVFSYLKDDKLGYFIVESADKTYRQENALATIGSVRFGDVALGTKKAICTARVTYGSDTSTISCVDETDAKTALCSGTTSIVAIPN